jgi:WD40 repeat protein
LYNVLKFRGTAMDVKTPPSLTGHIHRPDGWEGSSKPPKRRSVAANRLPQDMPPPVTDSWQAKALSGSPTASLSQLPNLVTNSIYSLLNPSSAVALASSCRALHGHFVALPLGILVSIAANGSSQSHATDQRMLNRMSSPESAHRLLRRRSRVQDRAQQGVGPPTVRTLRIGDQAPTSVLREVAFSPSGQHVACADRRGITVVTCDSGATTYHACQADGSGRPVTFASMGWVAASPFLLHVTSQGEGFYSNVTQPQAAPRRLPGPPAGMRLRQICCAPADPRAALLYRHKLTGESHVDIVRLAANGSVTLRERLKVSGDVVALEWSTRGSRLAIGLRTQDAQGHSVGMVQLFPKQQGEPSEAVPFSDAVHALAWSDQHQLATVSPSGQLVLAAAAGAAEHVFADTQGVRRLCWASGGNLLAATTCDGRLYVCDPQRKSIEFTFDLGSNISTLQVLADSRHIYLRTDAGRSYLIDPHDPGKFSLNFSPGTLFTASPDGRLLARANTDHSITLTQFPGGSEETIAADATGAPRDLQWSHDGTEVVAVYAHHIRFIDLAQTSSAVARQLSYEKIE